MTKQKSALGRGLGALLPTESDDDAAVADLSKTRLYNFEDRIRVAGQVSEIDIGQIDPNPFQPRTAFSTELLEELAASIVQHGIIQPVTVRSSSAGRFQLISGERRLRAAEIAGLTTLPAFVRDADSEAMLEMALVENVQRASLNPIEIALGYQRLIDECDLTQEEVAEKIGKNRTTVANFLRLLKLPAEIQIGLKDRDLTVGHARALLPLESDDEKIRLLRQIVDKDLSVRAVEELVRKHLTKDKAVPSSKAKASGKEQREDPSLTVLKDRLRNALSTQIHIKPGSGKPGGRIEVEYYSDDDLERLVDIITG